MIEITIWILSAIFIVHPAAECVFDNEPTVLETCVEYDEEI